MPDGKMIPDLQIETSEPAVSGKTNMSEFRHLQTPNLTPCDYLLKISY